LLTGERPFAGDSNASTISAILRDTPPLVTEVRDTLPHHLGRIIRRCLAKEPERRYQSPVDLRNDLQELAEEVDSGDVSADVIEAGVHRAEAPSSGSRPVPSSDSIVLPGTRRMYRGVLGVIGVLVVAGVVWFMTQERDSQQLAGNPAAVSIAQAATLGVIGFENLSDPNDAENLDRVLTGLVTTGLAESGGLNVASTAKVLAARRQAGGDDRKFDASIAPEAARIAGATVMLVGQVIRDGERTILTAELVDVKSGNTLGSIKKQAATNSELFELAGGIAHDTRELMGTGASSGTAKDIDLAKSLTESPEAYRRFAAGEVAVR
jgi:TolB-like protein